MESPSRTPGNTLRPDMLPETPATGTTGKRMAAAGRVGTPENIRHLAVVLLGPASGFVTGQESIVDGGMRENAVRLGFCRCRRPVHQETCRT